MQSGFILDEIDALTGGWIGVFDTPVRAVPHAQFLRLRADRSEPLVVVTLKFTAKIAALGERPKGSNDA